MTAAAAGSSLGWLTRVPEESSFWTSRSSAWLREMAFVVLRQLQHGLHQFIHCGDKPGGALEGALLSDHVDRLFVEAHAAERFALRGERFLHSFGGFGFVLGGCTGGAEAVHHGLVVVLKADAAEGAQRL